jgi:carbon starvation protein
VLVYSIKVGAKAWTKKERTDKEAPFQPIPEA